MEASLIRDFLRKRRPQLAGALALAFGVGLFEALFVLILRWGLQTQFSESGFLGAHLALLALVVGMRTCFQYGYTQFQGALLYNWFREKRLEFMGALENSHFPLARREHAQRVRQILMEDLRRSRRGLGAWLGTRMVGLQLCLFLPLLVLFPPEYGLILIALGVPAWMVSRVRARALRKNSGLWLASRDAQNREIQQFTGNLGYLMGNGLYRDRAGEVESHWREESALEKKWEASQLLFPALTEWIYFMLVALLFFLGGALYADRISLDTVSFLVLLLLMYKPVREWARQHPGLTEGRAAWDRVAAFYRTLKEHPKTPPRVQEGALEFRKVRFGYGQSLVLNDFSMVVSPDSVTLLRGPNGSGKTSLLKLAAGLERPRGGDVFYPREWVSGNKLNLGYLPQDNARDIYLVARLHSLYQNNGLEVETVEGLLGLRPLLRRFEESRVRGEKTHLEFSGGEWRRLFLGWLFLSDRRFLLLDEPTVWLTGTRRLDILAGLVDYWKASGRGLLLASHDSETAFLCDEVFELPGDPPVVEEAPLKGMFKN